MVFSKKVYMYALLLFPYFLTAIDDGGWIVVGAKKRKQASTHHVAIDVAPVLPVSVPTQHVRSTVIPLHLAALNNDGASAASLIAGGIDINRLDQKGATALHWAAGHESFEAAEIILQHEEAIACLSVQDDEGKTPLHRAAGLKSDTMLLLVKYAPRSCIDLQDVDGSTALLWAASGGKLQAVKALLSKGADPNAQDHVRGRTALHWALRMRAGAVKKEGAQMRAKTAQAILRCLMQHGADPSIQDFEGFSAFYWARHLPKELSMLQPLPPRRSERIKHKGR
jgi:ankyrin repeat protein